MSGLNTKNSYKIGAKFVDPFVTGRTGFYVAKVAKANETQLKADEIVKEYFPASDVNWSKAGKLFIIIHLLLVIVTINIVNSSISIILIVDLILVPVGMVFPFFSFLAFTRFSSQTARVCSWCIPQKERAKTIEKWFCMA